jgi:hypothetical protein
MADLVWSDPDPDKEEFAISPRGAGYTFGSSIVKKFLEINGMNHVLRAHQLCMEGYCVMYDDRLSTVWSAPNYCYRSAQDELGDKPDRSALMISLLIADAVMLLVFSRYHQGEDGSSTCSTPLRRTNETGQIKPRLKHKR